MVNSKPPLQAGKVHSLQDLLFGAVDVALVALKAQAGHAGVALDVDGDGAAGLHGPGGQVPGEVDVIAGLGDVVLDQVFGVLGGGAAQDEDGGLHAGLTDLDGLVDAGNAQIVRAQLLQLFGDGNGPVAIGVGLHQAQIPGPLGGQGSQVMIIVGQPLHGHFRPGAFLLCFHRQMFLS